MQRICGTALNRVIPVSIRPNGRLTPQAFYSINTMSTVSKSESEWRAILSQEQVCAHFIPRFSKRTNSTQDICSLGFSVRKAPSVLALASTISTRPQVYTVVLDAEYHCTTAPPNSMCVFLSPFMPLVVRFVLQLVFRVDADGRPFSMVSLLQSNLHAEVLSSTSLFIFI